jgi:predicted GNAT family acetyltransferase
MGRFVSDHPGMRLVLTRDAREFARRTEAFLALRIERNLLATVLVNALDGAHVRGQPLLAYGLDDRDAVQFAALRTPPWFLLASELELPDARALVAEWLKEDPGLPGVDGTPETARAIAAAWRERAGGTTRCTMREAMHTLEEVCDPPRPAPGRLRLPREDERQLLIEWMGAFAAEAGVVGADQAEAMVDVRLARDALLVWDHGGPVCIVGTAGPIAGVTRLGPVYTPPEHRRHGYGGSAVAAVSRRALGQGASRCMLYTDLANPTSNRIYAEVGYRRAGEWEEHAFERHG